MRYLIFTLVFTVHLAYSQEEDLYIPDDPINENVQKTNKVRENLWWIETRFEGTSVWGLKGKDTTYLPQLYKRSEKSRKMDLEVLSFRNNVGLYNMRTLCWQIPPIYAEIKYVKPNLYAARKDGRFGLIDSTNQTVVNFDYDNIENHEQVDSIIYVHERGKGSFLFSTTTMSKLHDQGYDRIIRTGESNIFKVMVEDKANLMNLKGELLFEDWFDLLHLQSAKGIVAQKGNLWGIVSIDAKVLIPFQYMYIKRLSVYREDEEQFLCMNQENKYGVIDIEQNVLVPFEYDEAEKDRGTLGIVTKDTKKGVYMYRFSGYELIIPCEYDEIERVYGSYLVKNEDGFYIMSSNGESRNKKPFQTVFTMSVETYDQAPIICTYKNKTVLLDTDCNPLIEEDTKVIEPLWNEQVSIERFAYLKAQNKSGLWAVYKKGGRKVTEFLFEEIIAEQWDLIVFLKNGKHGLYDLKNEKVIVKAEYDNLYFDPRSVYGVKNGEVSVVKKF